MALATQTLSGMYWSLQHVFPNQCTDREITHTQLVPEPNLQNTHKICHKVEWSTLFKNNMKEKPIHKCTDTPNSPNTERKNKAVSSNHHVATSHQLGWPHNCCHMHIPHQAIYVHICYYYSTWWQYQTLHHAHTTHQPNWSQAALEPLTLSASFSSVCHTGNCSCFNFGEESTLTRSESNRNISWYTVMPSPTNTDITECVYRQLQSYVVGEISVSLSK